MVNLWPLVAFVVFLSACLVISEVWKSKLTVKAILMLVLGLPAAGFLLWPSLTGGAFVSTAGDTFLYTAFGQYVSNHHRVFVSSGLSPIDQFGAVMSETRFGTVSVLSFLAVLFHSTTAEILPLFAFVVLVNIFSGFVVLGRRFGCNRLLSLAAGLFAVVGGWTTNALHLGGLDNLLFLSLFPFLISRLELYRFGAKLWSTSLGLAILAAAVFYVYPEGLTIAGVMFFPFFCQSVWFGMYRRGRAWRRYLVSGCLVLVFITPCVRLFFGSMFAHTRAGFTTGLAGMVFPGLLSPCFLPAIFGLGQEYRGTICLPHDLVMPIMIFAFIVVGCTTWIKQSRSLILVFLIFVGMAVWQGLLVKDDYGLYKILFLGSLVWIPALFLGGTAVAAFVPGPIRPLAVTLGTIILLAGAIAQRMEQQDRIPWAKVTPIKWYSDLAYLRHMVGNRKVLLVCEDSFDQEWALFFLRNVNLKVPEYLGFLGMAFGEYLQRAKSVSEAAAFVLVNQPIEGAVWKNERFSLFELGSQPKLIDVQGANGLQHVNGKPFVWLGNNASRFLIISNMAQTAEFQAWPIGPSRPENKDRQIRISIGDNVWQADGSGTLSLEVPLKPGLNYLDIACEVSPKLSAEPDGQPRTFPLGLWDTRISSQEGVSN